MWPNPQETAETADLVTFTEEILNGKLHFFVKRERCRIGWPYQKKVSRKTTRNNISEKELSIETKINQEQYTTTYHLLLALLDFDFGDA